MFEKRIAITAEFLDDLNHINYLNYIRLLGEAAFLEYRDQYEICLPKLAADFGVALVVAELNIKYFLPLKIGDTAIVQIPEATIEGNRLLNYAAIKKHGCLMAELRMTMMAVDFNTGTPCAMPAAVFERITNHPIAA